VSPFRRDAWEGTVPLVAPMPAPLEVGALAWERQPEGTEESDYEKRGGCIVARTIDHDTGAVESVTVVNGTRRHGRFEMRRFELAADTIDRDTVEAVTRERLSRTVVGCCGHVWEQLGSGRVARRLKPFERWLLQVAVDMDRLAAEMDAADTAAQQEHRAS
jgi:hypothetical protein